MHPFSACLSSLVKKHQMKKITLSQSLDIDYSTLHQILVGKRFPATPEIIDSISDCLGLSTEEHIELKEAWKIEKYGPVVYYRRHHVREFLESFSIIPGSSSDLDNEKENVPESRMLLSGEDNIVEAIRLIVQKETSAPGGRIALMFQPDQHAIMQQILQGSTPHPFRVDQIICLNNTDTLDENHQIVNLSLLSHAFTVYGTPNVSYRPFYHYDDIETHHAFKDMSCLFLTSDCAITFQNDLTKGILYTDHSCVSLHWDLFRKCRQTSASLIQSFPVGDSTPIVKGDVYVPVVQADQDLIVCINNQEMALIHNRTVFLIQEISILSAFRDFLTNDKENDIYVKQNGKEILESLWK